MSSMAKATATRPPSPRGHHRATSTRGDGTGHGRTLGLGASTTAELIQQVERGLSFTSLRRFEVSSGMRMSELAPVLGIPERTLARRRVSGKLAPEESERLLRISNLFEKAVAMFDGEVEPAVQWLTTPKQYLENQAPLRYARTELGAREVENLLGRLEHGVFS
jgi:putative toxin-antitoxin system antitoxin component (TIGR02293 family)